ALVVGCAAFLRVLRKNVGAGNAIVHAFCMRAQGAASAASRRACCGVDACAWQVRMQDDL
ncbi:hypothetical protein, partial [Xanthomonas oryzae]|uniref:hypothetical protein n=1 Tax=Xanthomonas oryzae TaxID=347 RepID=UPI001C6758EE